jgi:hypothetical protein
MRYRRPWNRIRTSLVPLALALLALPASAPAYKIWPIKSIHEAMTLLAESCALEARGAAPLDCKRLLDDIDDQSSILRPAITYDDLQIAVRWADDPGRQVRTAGIFNFGSNMYLSCARSVRVDSRIDVAGILCSSHFGRLQFLHAQAIDAAEEGAVETTREKVIEWAELTYRIAIGDVHPSEGICSYFRAHPSAIAPSFELADPARCDGPDAWSFSTLFGWRCPGLSMGRCLQVASGPGRDMLAVRTARGALLHAIQDSYSQSHAVRGPASSPYDTRIDCSLPTRFYTFLGQRDHGRADNLPSIADNCRAGGEAHDVVTASAMTLYHINRRTDPDVFSYCYLQRRVFGVVVRRPGEAAPPSCPADT